MSFDIVGLLWEMDLKAVELQLGLQCAPVLTGLKASNLFTVPVRGLTELYRLLKGTEFSFQLLYSGKERAVVLIYCAEKLSAYLRDEKTKKLLSEFGYGEPELSEIFPKFILRYKEYMQTKRDFPHELGLLLAYPVEDVRGFILHRGKGFLHSGYWKVYADAETKIALFKRFEEVQTELVKLLHQGVGILEAKRLYGSDDRKRVADRRAVLT